jgi:hypothetical protein
MKKSFLGNLSSIILKTCNPMKCETEKDREFLRSMLEKDSNIQCVPLTFSKDRFIKFFDPYLKGYLDK